VGDAPVMQAVLVTCLVQEKEGTPGAYNTVGLFETCITPLRKAQQPTRFTF
jgi:protein-L-isoaspartate(D-aspartate) O-methyltransferase